MLLPSEKTQFILKEFSDCKPFSKDNFEKQREEVIKKYHSTNVVTGNDKNDEFIKLITSKDSYECIFNLVEPFDYSNNTQNGKRLLRFKANNLGIDKISIPYGVCVIVKDAFFNKWGRQFTTNINSVTIPKSVRSIEENAFRNNECLKEVNFEHEDTDTLTIRGGAFADCTNLKSIELPRRTSISFNYNDYPIFQYLEQITFDSSADWCRYLSTQAPYITEATLTNLEKVTACNFSSNKRLTKISIPYAKTIGKDTFANCLKLEEVDLPEVKTIEKNAFKNCINLQKLSLPKVTKICEGAFANCVKLEEVDLPKKVIIEKNAFDNCVNLQKLSLPEVTEIREGAFANCVKLEEVYLLEVETIEKHAFDNCVSLQHVSLPKVTVLESETFRNCTSLESIYMPEIVTIKINAFSGPNYIQTRTSLDKLEKGRKTSFWGLSIYYKDMPIC